MSKIEDIVAGNAYLKCRNEDEFIRAIEMLLPYDLGRCRWKEHDLIKVYRNDRALYFIPSRETMYFDNIEYIEHRKSITEHYCFEDILAEIASDAESILNEFESILME